jgi:hypothetical protein
MLFAWSEFVAVCAFARSKADPMKPVRESLMRYVEGSSSASYSLKLARLEALKAKVNSTFLLIYKILRLLRHTKVKMDQVCQDQSGRLGGVAGSVVLYLILGYHQKTLVA